MPTAAAFSGAPPAVEAIAKPDAASLAPEDSAKPAAQTAEAARPGPGPTGAREPAPELRTRRTAPAAPPQAPTGAGKGLTDFGGRR
jgi:hypothetical protein